jgi:hypothetical protein
VVGDFGEGERGGSGDWDLCCGLCVCVLVNRHRIYRTILAFMFNEHRLLDSNGSWHAGGMAFGPLVIIGIKSQHTFKLSIICDDNTIHSSIIVGLSDCSPRIHPFEKRNRHRRSFDPQDRSV